MTACCSAGRELTDARKTCRRSRFLPCRKTKTSCNEAATPCIATGISCTGGFRSCGTADACCSAPSRAGRGRNCYCAPMVVCRARSA
jgi:hypothetical protein